MRILHTSDWHLGQYFIGKTREQEHRLFLKWLLQCVVEQEVDAVIIAGDIFDTGAPPSYARALLNQFIVDLQALDSHCQLIILGGNHDSVATLHESRSLFSYLNTHVVGAADSDSVQQVLVLNDKNNQPGLVVCAVPYIRPRDVLVSKAGDSGDQKQQALLMAMTEHYQRLHTVAEQQASQLGIPIVATGHLTTVGGKLSDSVRDIYIGSLSAFPVSAFPPASYIALGHLHRGQKVSGHNHIRYCGSPIPLSFDECTHGKQILLVDFDGAQLTQVTEVAVPLFRVLATLQGSIQALERQVQALVAEPAEYGLEPWIEVVVDEQHWISDLYPRVEALTAKLPLQLLRVRKKRQTVVTPLTSESQETLAELSVMDVFERRLQGEDLDLCLREQLIQTFQQLVVELEDDSQSGIEHDDDSRAGQSAAIKKAGIKESAL